MKGSSVIRILFISRFGPSSLLRLLFLLPFQSAKAFEEIRLIPNLVSFQTSFPHFSVLVWLAWCLVSVTDAWLAYSTFAFFRWLFVSEDAHLSARGSVSPGKLLQRHGERLSWNGVLTLDVLLTAIESMWSYYIIALSYINIAMTVDWLAYVCWSTCCFFVHRRSLCLPGSYRGLNTVTLK